MQIRIYLFLITLSAFGCNAQNSVTTNEIFRTKDNLFGVKSKAGKLLIDSVFEEIRLIYPNEKKMLPPKENSMGLKPPEYYLVSNSTSQKALFDKNGDLVFDFTDCEGMIVDEYTQTVVVTKQVPEHTQARSLLYSIDGALLMDTTYEHIAFIKHTDLIALVVEEGPKTEIYLYNPFEQKKLGPFDHFNIYNEESNLPMGMEASDFEKYRKLNVITVRREVDNDYIWGMVDAKGNEILPLSYKGIKILSSSDKSHPAFKRAIKPEGVDLIFKSALVSNPSVAIYFDSDLVQYEFKTISVSEGKYSIEKM
jgi:hypothetical protein